MSRSQCIAGSTAVPGGRVAGRPGNASRVLGRREGRTSVARSRWSFSAETFGDPALSSMVIFPGARPVGESPNTEEEDIRENEHPVNVNISSYQTVVWCDEALHSQCGFQGSIDEGDNQRSSIQGNECSWKGSRSKYFCRLQRRHNFGWRPRQHFWFKQTSTFAGIRLDRFWIGFSVDRVSIPRHVSFLTDPRDGIGRQQDPWGGCLSDIATIDTRTHAGSCVGDRYTSVREQHTRSCSFNLAFGSRLT